jgi:hypothetical protein
MLYKYLVLKSSWGIVIFLDMEEILNPLISNSDIKIVDRIYLRISDTKNLTREIILQWVGEGIKALAKEIYSKINESVVCFDIKKLDFNHIDFQAEGLYCAAREWLAKYYNLKIEPIKVNFDNAKNRYVFELSD